MFKAVLTGKTRDKNLKECSCLVPISVGQNLHEGEKLEATIGLINATFGSCVIVIADTLYRHTTPYNSGEIAADVHERTKEIGNEWKTRNAKALDQLAISHEILSWDDYIESEFYQAKKIFIEELYEEDTKFKKAVNGAIGKFIKRQKAKNSETNVDQAFNESLSYLKEECAVWLLWAEQAKPNFLVYPNKLYEPLTYLTKYFPKQSDIILQPLIISFKGKKETITIDDECGNGNGDQYVKKFVDAAVGGLPYQSNPAGFFNAKPPVCLEMSKSELSLFVQGHLNLMMETMKELDASRQQAFLTYYLAQLSQLTNPIIVIDDSDTSSDSSGRDVSPTLTPGEDPGNATTQFNLGDTK